uniref:STAS domain-containing protein n=1 Tax=Panagrolaimus sp. PS1159 TaxID=55785 RepID=A0AC35FDH2_9BILA
MLQSSSNIVYSEKVINQEEFDKKHGFRRVNLSLLRILEGHYHQVLKWNLHEWGGHYHQVLKWNLHEWGGFFKARVPIIEWLPSYDFKNDLVSDIIGGLMVSIMSIPQGLAYGFLVGLPPVFGLYSSIVPPLIYAFLGTSKHASPGAFAILALMVGSIVEQLRNDPLLPINDNNNTTEPMCCSENKTIADSEGLDLEVLAIVSCVTFMTGIIQILLGMLNAGLLAVWLSDHLVQGLTSGAAIHVLTSQLKSMTGIPNLPKTSDPNGIIKFYSCFFENIQNISAPETICSVICVFCLVFSKEFLDKVFSKWIKIKVPMELFVVVFSTLLNYTAEGTDYQFGLKHVGKVTSGMHTPFLPGFRYYDKVAGTAFSIAIISFVIHIALAKLISKKESYPLDANQEWLALGTMNTVGSFFGCFAGGSSLSRTMTQFKLKTKSQLSTVVCAVVLIGVVYGLSFCFYYLPLPVLSCIVVVALKDLLVQIFSSFSLFGQSFIDFLIWFVTFVAVVLVNVNFGLIIGVSFALLTVIFRSQWPESSLLGRIPGTTDFKGKLHYKDAEEVPGIFVFRFDAPLYFANAELFLSRVRDIVNIQPFVIAVDLKKKTNQEMAHQENQSKRELKQRNSVRQAEPTLREPLIPQQHGGKSQIELIYKGSRRETKSQRALDSQKSTTTNPAQSDTSTNENNIHITHIIIDCSSFPYIDLMGLDALGQVHSEFAALSIQVYFACCKVSVRQSFEQTDFYKKVPKTHLFVSVWDAVNQAQKDRSVMCNANKM